MHFSDFLTVKTRHLKTSSWALQIVIFGPAVHNWKHSCTQLETEHRLSPVVGKDLAIAPLVHLQRIFIAAAMTNLLLWLRLQGSAISIVQ